MCNAGVGFDAVSFAYAKESPIFQNLSVSFRDDLGVGKIVALMGPTGVGKTSFCELALGVCTPSSGEIRLEPENALTAAIPQKSVLFDELDIYGNISCLEHSRSLGRSFDVGRLDDTVRTLDLGGVLGRRGRPSELSGGEAQRVMLARTQMVDCHILVLDEPCSFLDNRIKESFLLALRRIATRASLLALMVTHVWDEAMLIADEVAFFYRATNGAASVVCSAICDAVARPPTIDAMYAIHWPHCVLLSVDELGLLPVGMRSQLPAGVVSVGLVGDGEHLDSGGPLGKVWRAWRQRYRSGATAEDREDSLGNEMSGRLRCIPYDGRGLAISHAGE